MSRLEEGGTFQEKEDGKVKWVKKYRCPAVICKGLIFNSWDDLEAHLKDIHQFGPMQRAHLIENRRAHQQRRATDR
jgi:hypothetical protein